MPNFHLTSIQSLILILSLLKENKIQVWIKSLNTASQKTVIHITSMGVESQENFVVLGKQQVFREVV